MQYWQFDPRGCDFPRPRVPVLPLLRRNSLRFGRSAPSAQLTSDPRASFYTRGRYALTDAYRLCGVTADTALLAPAYHCRTMLDPAIRLGAEVGLYAMNPDLAPDLEQLASCLGSCDRPVAALLLTHYFGFAQSLDRLIEFCATHDIELIEDCTHCLYGQPGGLVGQLGRYSVWSPYKFFPSADGGVLQANLGADPLPPPRRPRRWLPELKGMAHTLQPAWANDMAPDGEGLDAEIRTLTGDSSSVGSDLLHDSAMPSGQYEASMEGLQGLVFSRWIMRHTDVARLIMRRRKNYLCWAEAVARLPHCRALFPVLPDGCAPYMFPLYITHPEIHFFALKRLGVPIWRWDDMAVSGCKVASDYRLHLLHLPCHQELTPAQLCWMTSAVAKALTQLTVEPRT